ncbi:hypothetical protein M0802_012286, partial [Mischocyttarus mexicanus]
FTTHLYHIANSIVFTSRVLFVKLFVKLLSLEEDENKDLKKELEELRRELNFLKGAQVVPRSPPSPAPRTHLVSVKLREIVEIVPKFDGHNIPVSQFIKACRRALESLPLDYTEETETSLTRLLISKLNGHAYVVIENFRINKVEQLIERLKDAFLPAHSSNYYRGQLANEYKKPGEHVLDYYGRVRDLTQSIIDEESKSRGKLEFRMEREIEQEGLDAFIRGLPSEYRTAMRFEKYKDFNSALVCILCVNKEIQDDAIRSNSSNFRKNFSNIRQIEEVIHCTYCNKVGHSERECQQKSGNFNNNQAGRQSPKFRKFNSPDYSNNQTGRRSPTFKKFTSSNFKNNQAGRKSPIFGNSKPPNFRKLGKGSDGRRTPPSLSQDASNDKSKSGIVSIRQIIYKPVIGAPCVAASSPQLTGQATLMIDTGADVNLIKLAAIQKPTDIDSTKIIQLKENSSFCIPPRSSKFGYCHVINSELREGYIPRLELPPGVYAGEALVKNINGKAYFKISNKNQKSVTFEIPRLELLAFSEGTLPNSDSSISNSATNIPKSEPPDFLSSIHTIFAEAIS